MSAGSDNKLLTKLTIAADETPELFRALASVKDARRRTRRLKDLASKGFMVELSGMGISSSEPASRVAGADRIVPMFHPQSLDEPGFGVRLNPECNLHRPYRH